MFILLRVSYFSAQTADSVYPEKMLNEFELASHSETREFSNTHTVKIPLTAGTHCIITSDETDCLYFDTIKLKDPAVLIFSESIHLVEYNMIEERSQSNGDYGKNVMNLVAGGSGVPGKEEGSVQMLQPPAAAFCEGKVKGEIDFDPTLSQMESGQAEKLKMFIPNAFSPDGNGNNDRFIVVGDSIQSFHMNIFDRSGKLVFCNDNNEAGWDGRMENGRIPERSEVYIYNIQVTDLKGRIFTYTGHVTLIR